MSVEMTGGGASPTAIPSQGQTVRPQGRGKVPPPSENPQARGVGSGAEGCTWVASRGAEGCTGLSPAAWYPTGVLRWQ